MRIGEAGQACCTESFHGRTAQLINKQKAISDGSVQACLILRVVSLTLLQSLRFITSLHLIFTPKLSHKPVTHACDRFCKSQLPQLKPLLFDTPPESLV